LNKHYGVANLKALQNEWLAWVKDGSPDRGVMLASAQKKQNGSDGPVFRAQSDDRAENREQHCKRCPANSSSNELASNDAGTRVATIAAGLRRMRMQWLAPIAPGKLRAAAAGS